MNRQNSKVINTAAQNSAKNSCDEPCTGFVSQDLQKHC